MLACATYPLIWWGGFVTATGAGMAFRDWLTSDGQFMLTYPWLSSAGDKFIEHGHRLLGVVAGLAAIGLVVVAFRAESRRWVRWFSVALLLGVVLQGLLGGMRVVLDERSASLGRTLALIHGCTGPLFFICCIVMATVTSRIWRRLEPSTPTVAGARLARFAIICAVTAYLQLVAGAVLRHGKLMIGDNSAAIFQTAVYFHLLLAVLVAGQVCVLAVGCVGSRTCGKLAVGLASLVGVQLGLGLFTWFYLYGIPRWALVAFGEFDYLNVEADVVRSAVVTAHGAVGALIAALAAAIGLLTARQYGLRWSVTLSTSSRMAGAVV